MDERENEQQQKPSKSEEVMKTAEAAVEASKAAAKASAKAAAGDEVGAAVEVVKAAPSFFTLIVQSVKMQIAIACLIFLIPAILISILLTPLQIFSTFTSYDDQYGTFVQDEAATTDDKIEYLKQGKTFDGYDVEKGIDEQDSKVVSDKLNAGIKNHYLTLSEKGDHTDDFYYDSNFDSGTETDDANDLVDENGLTVGDVRPSENDAGEKRHKATKIRLEARAKETRRAIVQALEKQKGKIFKHIIDYLKDDIDAFNEPIYGTKSTEYALVSFNMNEIPDTTLAQIVSSYSLQQNAFDESGGMFDDELDAAYDWELDEDPGIFTFIKIAVSSALDKINSIKEAFIAKLTKLLNIENVYDVNFVNYLRWIGYEERDTIDELFDNYVPWKGTFLPQPMFEELTQKKNDLARLEMEKKHKDKDDDTDYDSEISTVKKEIEALEKYQTGLVNYVVRASKPTCNVYAEYKLADGTTTTLEEVEKMLEEAYKKAYAAWQAAKAAYEVPYTIMTTGPDGKAKATVYTPTYPHPAPSKSDYSDPGMFIKKTIVHIDISSGVEYANDSLLQNIIGFWTGGGEGTVSIADNNETIDESFFADDTEIMDAADEAVENAKNGTDIDEVKEDLFNADNDSDTDTDGEGEEEELDEEAAMDEAYYAGLTGDELTDDDEDADDEDSTNTINEDELYANLNPPFDIESVFDESNSSGNIENDSILDDSESEGAGATGTPAGGSGTDTTSTDSSSTASILFTSDYQKAEGWGTPKSNLSLILRALNRERIKLDNAVVCGDYSVHDGTHYNGDPDPGIKEIKSVFSSLMPSVDQSQMVFEQGNHDEKTSLITNSGLHDYGSYYVYVLNTQSDFPSQQGKYREKSTVINGAQKLADALKELDAKGDSKPVFIAGHTPLHFTGRTGPLRHNGDNMYSAILFDVLNTYGKNLNLVYLFGHNHANGWECYMGGSCIFREEGDWLLIPKVKDSSLAYTYSYSKETINFTYLNAGFIGHFTGCEKCSPAAETKLTCTLCEIGTDEMKFTKYYEGGAYKLNGRGTENPYKKNGHRESDYIPSKYYAKERTGSAVIKLKKSTPGATSSYSVSESAYRSSSSNTKPFYYTKAFGFTDEVLETMKKSLQWGRNSEGKLVSRWKMGEGTEVPEGDADYDNEDVTFIRIDPYQTDNLKDAMKREMQLAGVLQTDEEGSGDNLVAMANAEWAKVWKDETQTEHADHYDKSVATGKKYQDDAGIGEGPWCCAFVYWCADQCGYIGDCFGEKTALCQTSWNYFSSKGLTHGKAGYTPEPGDLIYYHYSSGSANATNHIGIVESCDGTYVNTIEGNTHNGTVYKHHYPLSQSTIYGYASPEYPAGFGSLANAERPQDYFYAYGLEQGYSPGGVCTLMGNIYQECGWRCEKHVSKIKSFVMAGKDEWGLNNKNNLWDLSCDDGGASIGIIQWQGDRRAKLEKFATANGMDWKSIEAQAAFCFHEIATGYKTTRETIKQNLTTDSAIRKATEIVANNFEGMHPEDACYDVRKEAAVAYYEYYKTHSLNTGGVTGAGSAGDFTRGETANATKYLLALKEVAKIYYDNHIRYDGSGVNTLEDVLRNKKSDCSTYAFVSLQRAGFVPRGTRGYGNKNGVKYKTHGCRRNLEKVGKIVPVKRPFRSFVAKRQLKPGDLVFMNTPHTMVFAGYDSHGNDYWWSVDHTTMKKRNLLRKGGYGRARIWAYFRLDP